MKNPTRELLATHGTQVSAILCAPNVTNAHAFSAKKAKPNTRTSMAAFGQAMFTIIESMNIAIAALATYLQSIDTSEVKDGKTRKSKATLTKASCSAKDQSTFNIEEL